jgi:hypothetical protein
MDTMSQYVPATIVSMPVRQGMTALLSAEILLVARTMQLIAPSTSAVNTWATYCPASVSLMTVHHQRHVSPLCISQHAPALALE